MNLHFCLSLQFQCGVLWIYVCFISSVSAWRAVGFRGFHSHTEVVALLDMQVHILSALQDNYMYLVSSVIFVSVSLICCI